jgi:cyclopropane fatty-acyl-phospholipid synthase-like methyltransferase
MVQLELLVDLHVRNRRQGPGADEETIRALELARIPRNRNLTVADIGCGTGASSLVLARELEVDVLAVDLFPRFLTELESRASAAGLCGRISTLAASMDALPFETEQWDVIWSEGAIYNLGFELGINMMRSFLKQGGILALSEITWLTQNRPEEIAEHWVQEYPEIATSAQKMAQLERAGYTPLGYFVLPPSCWIKNYYEPLEASHEAFLKDHHHSRAAQAVVDEGRREFELYRRYANFFSYGFYIAKRL